MMVREPIIPRFDMRHIPEPKRIAMLLAEHSDYVRVNKLAELADMELQSTLRSLRQLEKVGLVISRKDGQHKNSPISFMLAV